MKTCFVWLYSPYFRLIEKHRQLGRKYGNYGDEICKDDGVKYINICKNVFLLNFSSNFVKLKNKIIKKSNDGNMQKDVNDKMKT